MPPHLHLLSLGAPLVLTDAGEQVRFRTRKHLALLIRLALEAGKRFTRDYLIDLLWAEAPAPLARHSLAQGLTVLKAKVGREHVLIQRATVALAEGVVDTDVGHLDAYDAQVRGQFLDGFEIPGARPFEQWKDEWHARLMPRIRDCLVKQMDAGRRIGDFATVERHAQVLYELDPLSEDAVRGLMEARAWVGDRSNALKVYGRFEARLADELGAKPSLELSRVANLLREGRRAAPRSAATQAPPLERADKRFDAETLIGREAEFGALYDAWLAARHRTPRIVVVSGDPGVGKTTLSNAFAATCQMEGAVVARAQAYDAERELPFAVLAELVRQLTLQHAIGSAEPDALAELSRICPEIFSAFPGVPKPTEWSAEVTQLRLADAFLKAAVAAAEETPVVLVVDDIHAADNASAAILHVMARKLANTRLLLVLTGRPSELRSSAAPAALVSDASIQGLQTLELEPLSADAAARLVAILTSSAGPELGATPAERILQAGSGNPLAIELLTREWLAHGPHSLLRDLDSLNTQPVANLGIPRAIRTVFERQIQRLHARTRAVLDLAAVLGRRLLDLSLYEAVNLTQGDAAEALSRLREEGVFREVRGDLEFRNELIRAQAYYAVAGPARQHLHRRVADLLAARPGDEGKSLELEIAWHYLRGGDSARALPYALEGAEAALNVGAPYEAEQILSVLLRGQAVGASIQRIRLLLAKALLGQSKAEAAMPVLEPLLSDPTLSARDVAEATRMHASAVYLFNRETGSDLCEATDKALAAAQTTKDLELTAQALFEYARSGAVVGDEDRVRAAQAGIRQTLQSPGAASLPVLHYAQGYCDYFFFNVRSAAVSIQRSIELLADSSDLGQLSLALTGDGVCKQALCDFDSARDAFLAALQLAKRMGDDSRASIISSNLCQINSQQGRYADAIHFGHLSVQWGTRSLNQPNLVGTYTNLAETSLLTGNPSKAMELLDRARDWMTYERSWSAKMAFLCGSVCMALMMGNVSSALELIASIEKMAWGRERAVPDAGGFETYRVFRAAHLDGQDKAFALAADAIKKFRGRHTVFYLDVLASKAWLEKRFLGGYSPGIETELKLFETLSVRGKRAMLAAQGFLTG